MKISKCYTSGTLTVFLSGELDHHCARATMDTIDALISEYLPRETALDMSGLSFMDSSGIALILKLDRRMRELGGRSHVQNAADQPLKVIDAAGIERLIPIKGGIR